MRSSKTPKHQPRKRFGQNFLRDEAIIDQLGAAINPRSDDHIVEIGPGLGALTQVLLASACQLDAIELDRDLVAPLLAAFSVYPNFTLHSADALSFDFSSLHGSETPLRVVGNLPYNISTPLIFKLLDESANIVDMHFMLQLEVVQRLCAEPGSKHWGRLAIMTHYSCNAELLFEVPPTAFDPPPKVQSAIVRLEPHQKARPEGERDNLAKIVKAAFAQRRKTLRNNLKGIVPESDLLALGIDPNRRAETVSLDEFLQIANRPQIPAA